MTIALAVVAVMLNERWTIQIISCHPNIGYDSIQLRKYQINEQISSTTSLTISVVTITEFSIAN